LGKVDKFASVLVVDVDELDHSVIVQFSGVAQWQYLNMRLGRR